MGAPNVKKSKKQYLYFIHFFIFYYFFFFTWSIDELTHNLTNLEISHSYNEVNFNAVSSDILGLFLSCRSLDKIDPYVALETAYMQKLLKEKFSLELPCFAFFFEMGKIQKIDFSLNTLTYYILRLKNIHSDFENAKFYANKFNVEIKGL